MAASAVRFIIAIHAVANLTIGTALLLWSNILAESLLNMLFPSWLWPSMFIAAGVIAIVGIWCRPWAQFAYAFAGIVTLVFGAASAAGVYLTGNLAAIATTVFLVYIAIMKFEIAWMIQQRDIIVQQIVEATEAGKSALEKTGDHGAAS